MDDDTWRKYRSEFINRLDVDSPEKYIEKFTDGAEVKSVDVLEQMGKQPENGLRGFSRRYPNHNQDIMVVLTNPALKGNSIGGDDNEQLARTDDMRERERICVEGSYFKGGGTAERFRYKLAEAMVHGILPNPFTQDRQSSIADEMKTSGWKEIYLTNFYKLATEGSGNIPKWVKSEHFVVEMLEKEINSVDPDYIVCFGRHAWEGYFRNNVEWMPETKPDTNKTPSEIGIQEATGNQFYHPDTGRIILASQHPRPPLEISLIDPSTAKDLER